MKKRIISAFIMAIIAIPLLIIGGVAFRIGVGILGILAYKEILDLKGIKNYPIPVVIIGLVVMMSLIFSNRELNYNTLGLDYRYIAFAILCLLLPAVLFYSSKKYSTKDALFLLGFVLFIGITLNLLTNILIYDARYFYLIVLTAIFTDTFAYFTGMMIGKHKVTKISPNKSMEGYIGGVVMATILSSIYYMTFIGNSSLWSVIPVLIILSIISELGDLFYSAIKRDYEIKDFSNLIPGHGGILDRIDSLTFVTIAFVLLRSFI